jgi:hypothetical protein
MIMAEAAQADPSGAWTTLASAVQLHQDPGAAVAFVEAVADAVASLRQDVLDANGNGIGHFVGPQAGQSSVGADTAGLPPSGRLRSRSTARPPGCCGHCPKGCG